jgi:hypothetical protein
MNDQSNKITTEEMQQIFGYLVNPVVLDIDKEIEALKIPEGDIFL